MAETKVTSQEIDLATFGVVTSDTNPGSAGGTRSYVIHPDGTKEAWGLTSAFSIAGNTTVTRTVTLPSSFFNSVTQVQLTLTELSNDARQVSYIPSAPNTSSISLSVQGLTGSTAPIGGKWYWRVTGT